ncbi:MAG: 3,4-dihydroxy-2-butanone-4-phosphate synthase, partial [Chloroflexota bacterium]|nr:3,4-dihydroxy-2-butanone-4-phosphate synthase [Chloroflexota bacterium]
MPPCTIEEALEEMRAGRSLILVDDEGRENEGDLVMAAEKVTPEAINFMARHARGLICMPMLGARLEELRIPLMVHENTERMRTAFAVSVDYKVGTTTGISAHDRAATVRALVDPNAKPNDFAQPGHLFPLRYQEGGVLVRAGHTEATVDLCRLAGLQLATVLCEIMNEDGTMARMPQLEEFSKQHGIKILTIAQIIAYRRAHVRLVKRVAETRLPTRHGLFKAIAYRSVVDPDEHLALVMGEIRADQPVLVRVHSECVTGDVFGSVRCDCGDQLHMALDAIAHEGKGVFLYMRQEGRG